MTGQGGSQVLQEEGRHGGKGCRGGKKGSVAKDIIMQYHILLYQYYYIKLQFLSGAWLMSLYVT